MLDPFTCASKLPVTGHWWLGACNRWKDESECAHDRASGASVSLRVTSVHTAFHSTVTNETRACYQRRAEWRAVPR